MAKDYIPRANDKFDTFQGNLVTTVVAKATAWNIPAGEVSDLQAASVKYGNLYKIISVKGSRTVAQVADYNQFRKTYEADLRLFVNAYLRSNKKVSGSDAMAMGIKLRGKRRKKRSQITTAPELFIETKGGLRIRFVCRIEAHYGKGSIHPESDGLELRYSIGNPKATFESAEIHYFSKKAHFLLAFGPEHAGKKIYVFARWKNNVDDSLSGPWCEVVTGTIY